VQLSSEGQTNFSNPGDQQDYVAVATVGKPVGLDGWCRVFPFGATLENTKLPFVFTIQGNAIHKTVTLKKIRKDVRAVLALFFEFNSRDEVDTIKNFDLMVPRKDLPTASKNEYYHFELLGMKVFTDTGQFVGTVTEVHNYPTTDALEVLKEGGLTSLIPISGPGIQDICRETGKITILESFTKDLL
jgi:16S rRNA processing protein RimM